jgi:hypothetical protein
LAAFLPLPSMTFEFTCGRRGRCFSCNTFTACDRDACRCAFLNDAVVQKGLAHNGSKTWVPVSFTSSLLMCFTHAHRWRQRRRYSKWRIQLQNTLPVAVSRHW